MSKVTQNKVLNSFNEFSHPGGPYFSPRNVRQFALKAMGIMFPEGRKARKLVHSVFRVMHPFHWSKSVVYHTIVYTTRVCKYTKDKCKNAIDYIVCRRIWKYIETNTEDGDNDSMDDSVHYFKVDKID
jgi:hypothetical protein